MIGLSQDSKSGAAPFSFWSVSCNAPTGLAALMGVSPRPILMGAPLNAVKRSKRKYHYRARRLSPADQPRPAYGVGSYRSLPDRGGHGVPAAWLFLSVPAPNVSVQCYSVFKLQEGLSYFGPTWPEVISPLIYLFIFGLFVKSEKTIFQKNFHRL